MISWLIDGVLLSALVVTSWRTGRMVQELRRLRTEEASFGKALAQSDDAINRAAHAVVMLKSEGLKTIAALETRIAEARILADQLEDAARLAALQLELANDNGFSVVPLAPEFKAERAASEGVTSLSAGFESATSQSGTSQSATSQSEWMRRLESRLASASTLKR